jgi:hypothetical protein
MLGIHIAAIIAAVLALCGVGGIILLTIGPRERLLMAVLILVELPASWLGVACLRPAIDGLLGALSPDPETLQFLRVWYAPLTEEPLKLLPLLVPFVFHRVDARNGVVAGLALGLGFGIGEIGYLASVWAKVPQYAALGPAHFSGFILERLQACIFHSAMTATVVWQWLRGARWGILVAIAIHFALNFPIYLRNQGAFELTRAVLTDIVFVWFSAATIALAFWIVWMIRKPPKPGQKTAR